MWVPQNLYLYAFTEYMLHSFVFTFLIFGLSDEFFLRIGLYDKVEEGYEFRDKVNLLDSREDGN